MSQRTDMIDHVALFRLNMMMRVIRLNERMLIRQDDDLMAYMRAVSDMQKQLQSQIQTYDKVDLALAAKMGR
ncbi:hypothetical protein P4631_19415 [Halalkalibacterium halodurans]|uniref:hypothetical protein n=1 Tax=Halalkalibacterium halodurans TaxID=86665 RepID=UPI002E24A85B|nr:hypothetical protein [Halalkalibacterium halodurans]